MDLVDYKVRVINARAGTAARVRVVIESKDQRLGLGDRRRLRERDRGELARPDRRLRAQAVQGRSLDQDTQTFARDRDAAGVIVNAITSHRKDHHHEFAHWPGTGAGPGRH